MTESQPTRRGLDRWLSRAIATLAVLVFAYGTFLAYEKGDLIMLLLAPIAIIVSLVAAIRWCR